MNCYISTLRTIEPRFAVDQQSAGQWLAAAHARAAQSSEHLSADAAAGREAEYAALLARLGGYPDRIERRFTELEDHTHTNWHKARIFNFDQDARGRSMADRMSFFQEVASARLNEFYLAEERSPTALLHVTCTGYASPSAAQIAVSERGWEGDTSVIHAYHMGCYASMPAIRLGRGLLHEATDDERIDICHTELCTLHLDPTNHGMEQLVVQSLFADGHAFYSLTKRAPQTPGFEVLAIHDEILPNSQAAMSWVASDFGMHMTLSVRTPLYIQRSIAAFVSRLVEGAAVMVDPSAAIFAVHPGGPRIIDAVSDALELEEKQISHSRQVLKGRGNMSSATLPHVWQAILRDPAVKAGTCVVSLAFGPGLTVYGSLFRKAET